ncbi:MAG TPA: TIGR02710 family CRISPR-associated CARF protein, partial [Phycisphaerae bacterium]|nr:TIGR02710 family CRISPR-associated CARF protein [Phycisphaerae bacterium]
VGGQQRNKDGVGVVVSGREQQFTRFNPWDALGYQAVEDAVAVFNHGGYAAAAHLLDDAVKNAAKPEVKRELSTLKAVIDAYAAWDRFDHKEAAQRFADALKNRNDLAAVLHDAPSLITRPECHRDRVVQLSAQNEATAAWVDDLVQNARRRAAERRFDDAVARLYRAFEALAQLRLREQHRIPDTKSVSLAQLPDSLRTEWADRGRDSRRFMLGLQDAWRVLKEFGDELGRKFFALGLADEQRSPLVARNQSILAHGFQPVGQPVYGQLDAKLRSLASLDEGEPQDWRLPAPGDARRRQGPAPR